MFCLSVVVKLFRKESNMTQVIGFRVNDNDLATIERNMTLRGFSNRSSYLLWLIRNDRVEGVFCAKQ